AHVKPIGQRRQRNIGQRHRRDAQHQPAIPGGKLARGEHRPREQEQPQRHRHRDQQRQHHAIGNDMGRIAIIMGQALGNPALLPERAKLRGHFDHHQRRGEPPQRIGTVEPPGNEQERETCGQTQQEAKEIAPDVDAASGAAASVRGRAAG
ncbi:hypothetical protein E4T56_gene153, partial [Termitomyces sp. T112]